MKKTNAMRMLNISKVQYQTMEYTTEAGAIDGLSVAAKTGKNPEIVYKTLITKGKNDYYCFVIPVGKELNLKQAAAAVGEKSIEMLKQDLLKEVTGYIRGGCSPIGMKKQLVSVLDESAKQYERILVSGGKIGLQVELSVEDLLAVIKAKVGYIT